MRTREPCGCKHDGVKWLEMCEAHAAEFNERHVQAQIDYNEREHARDNQQSEAI